MSTGFQVLTEVQTLVQALTLTGIGPTQIIVQEIAIAEGAVYPTPIIVIAPFGAFGTDPIGFEGSVDVEYGVEVCIIEATRGEYGGPDQDKRQGWAESVNNKILFESNGDYRTNIAAIESIWNIEQIKNPVFDRPKFSELYAFSSLIFKFHSAE